MLFRSNRRDERIAEHVTAKDASLGQAAGTGGAHIIGIHLGDQARSQIADQHRREGERNGEGRQEQVMEVLEERVAVARHREPAERAGEHTSELQSLMRTSSSVFCLKKKSITTTQPKQQLRT